MIYFDTAYLAKCYLHENGSDDVRALARKREHVACCAFGRVELAATFHRNFREGKITASQRDLIFLQLQNDDAKRLWTWLPIPSELLLETVDRFRTLDCSVYVRTADALHLTCARAHGFKEIYSNDRRLLSAAGAFEVSGRNVI